MDMHAQLVHAVTELDEELLWSAISVCLQERTDIHKVENALQEGLRNVGQRFAKGEYYLADMIVGSDLYQEAMRMVLNHQNMECLPAGARGRVLIGVMENDIHDIGKDIVKMLLLVDGFEVVDLGVDVATPDFTKAVEEHRPDIVALCGVMTFSSERMADVIRNLNQLPFRDSFKIIVGGSCIGRKEAMAIGADGYTRDAYDVTRLCKSLLGEE